MRTCRKILLVAAAALLSATAWGGIGATHAWVANYVSNYVSRAVAPTSRAQQWSESGTNYMVYGGYTMYYEDATETALKIVESTEASRLAGVTNGLCFALANAETGVFVAPGWVVGVTSNGPYLVRGVYSNGAVNAASSATQYGARADGIQTWFVDAATNRFARVARTLLQPGVAARILREAGQ